jgi:type III pantothenate kinase
LTRVFSKVATKYFQNEALVVGPTTRTDLEIALDDPRSVGADRIVNGVAAKHLFGAPVVVVDMGTATTFDIIGPSGRYEGGMISPGLMISAQALFSRAAMLSNIELKHPPTLIGKNTRDAMLSGIVYGYVGLVDGILARIRHSFGTDTTTIATGGLASLIAAESQYITTVVPELTLTGLKIIDRLNRTTSP